ncbi:MAG: glycerate kinase, partial [Verrucomicrobiae bacterium]|nr:glycerate kinase [Verrucomicrobiae bacterium]
AWVITGEGCFDATSLHGKVVATVFTIARAQRARVALIAGQIRTEPPAPVVRALSLLQPGMTVAEAMTNAERLLSERVAELADHIRHSDGP